MAKQIGTLKVQGTVDNVTFAQTADGYIARKKNFSTGSKLKNSPAYQRTRETMSEFTNAAKAGKLIRQAIPTLLQECKDPKLSSRMVKMMFEVLKTDTTNARGQRSVSGGDVTLLQGLNFNINSHLDNILAAPYTVTLNRVTGELRVAFDAFIPSQVVSAPANATHFKIVSAGMDINFSDGVTLVDLGDSSSQPYGNTPTGALSLSHSLSPNSVNPLFLIMGVRFYEEVNSIQYPLKDSGFTPLTIVKVSVA